MAYREIFFEKESILDGFNHGQYKEVKKDIKSEQYVPTNSKSIAYVAQRTCNYRTCKKLLAL